jgi:hypothetical protein
VDLCSRDFLRLEGTVCLYLAHLFLFSLCSCDGSWAENKILSESTIMFDLDGLQP